MILGPELGGVYYCNKTYNIGGPISFEENNCYVIGFVKNIDGNTDMYTNGIWFVYIEEYKKSGSVLIRYWWEILPKLFVGEYIKKLSNEELIIKDIIE